MTMRTLFHYMWPPPRFKNIRMSILHEIIQFNLMRKTDLIRFDICRLITFF